MSDRLGRTARRAARSRRIPPEDRERLEEELRGHLEDSAREYEALGYSRRRSERSACRDLGDVTRVRTDLGRAWRGHRVVVLPEAEGEQIRSFLIYDSRVALLIIALVILLRWQVVAAYHIPTKSMEPTLHGDPAYGDKILVNKLYYRLYPVERWQIAVFEREGDDRSLIKRVAGLPGELLDIRNGDLYIDERIIGKPRSVQEELLVPVFADNRQQIAEAMEEPRVGLAAWTAVGNWTERNGTFVCDAGVKGDATLEYFGEIRDDCPGAEPRSDGILVGDLVLRFRVTPGERTTVLGAELREAGNTFQIWLPVRKGGTSLFLLNKEEVARNEGFILTAGEEHEIRFANLDDRITLEVDGDEIFEFEYAGDAVPASEEGASAGFGFRGGRSVFKEVELSRDIHYRVEGRLPNRIPAEHYFMLGDNSGNSADSRNGWTVPEGNLIGRPLIVFWPPSRLKLIR